MAGVKPAAPEVDVRAHSGVRARPSLGLRILTVVGVSRDSSGVLSGGLLAKELLVVASGREFCTEEEAGCINLLLLLRGALISRVDIASLHLFYITVCKDHINTIWLIVLSCIVEWYRKNLDLRLKKSRRFVACGAKIRETL